MTTPQTRQFDTGDDAYADLCEFVESFCAGAGIEPRTIAVLMLICEELFENTRRHGYPAAPDSASGQPIWLTLAVTGDCIDAVYEDAAPGFDPFVDVSTPDYSGTAETWQVGGLGIPLIVRLTRERRYEHSGERNRIRFSVSLDGAVN